MMFKYIFNEDLGSDGDFKGKTWMSNRQRYDRLPAEIEIWDHTSYIFEREYQQDMVKWGFFRRRTKWKRLCPESRNWVYLVYLMPNI